MISLKRFHLETIMCVKVVDKLVSKSFKVCLCVCLTRNRATRFYANRQKATLLLSNKPTTCFLVFLKTHLIRPQNEWSIIVTVNVFIINMTHKCAPAPHVSPVFSRMNFHPACQAKAIKRRNHRYYFFFSTLSVFLIMSILFFTFLYYQNMPYCQVFILVTTNC